MTTRTPILVGTDGSEKAMHAVLWAADEAARRGAELRIVAIHEPWYDPHSAATDLKEAEERDFRAHLAEAEAAVGRLHPELAVRTDLLAGEAVEVLGEESTGAYAVVVGSRGRGGFPGLVLGSTSLRLGTHARAPMVIVPGPTDSAQRGVVVGIDGSEHSRRALAFAFDQAARREVGLNAVWVIQEPSWFGPAGSYAQWLAGAAGTTEERIVEELAPWRRDYPDVEVEATVVWGHPVAMLRRQGERAELLVVGSRRRNIARSVLLGSVSHGLLHHAPCPVAIAY